jgi:hypothetical protein
LSVLTDEHRLTGEYMNGPAEPATVAEEPSGGRKEPVASSDETSPSSDDAPSASKVKALGGSSPYSTGGGGVSFAGSVATVYLASMLTGSRRPEASELPVRRVAFQTGPKHPVDDLLVTCGDGESEVTLAVACRATPDFVQSDAETVRLISSLLAEVGKFDTNTHRVAVAAAGRSTQWDQLATLSDIARGARGRRCVRGVDRCGWPLGEDGTQPALPAPEHG